MSIHEMNAGKAAYILSQIIYGVENDKHHRPYIDGDSLDAITFAYSVLQDMANADQGEEGTP